MLKAPARVETAADAVKAAASHPGVPLRRRKGSSDPFAPVASNAASDWSAALAAAVKTPRPTKTVGGSPVKPPAPSRRALDKAEAELAELEGDRARALAEFDDERRALEARESELKDRFKTKVAKARARVTAEEKAFREAGG